MERVKILAIAPYEGLKTMMRNTAQAWEEIDLTVEVGDLEAAIQIAAAAPWDQFDVLVSRGGTARMLKHHVGIPIVEIPVSVYDVLRSLKMAELYTQRVAVVGYANITECVLQLKDMMGYGIEVYTIDDSTDRERLLDSLRQLEYDLLLCDMISYQSAKKRDLNALLITSGEESVAAAFEECVRISRAYKTTKVQRDLLRYCLTEHCHEACVYSEGGTLEFSTLPRSGENSAVFDAIQARLGGYQDTPIVLDQVAEAGAEFSVKGQRIQAGGGTYLVLYLTFEGAPAGRQAGEAGAPKGDEGASGDLRQMMRTIYAPHILEIVDNYARCAYPILLTGESGCGKDTVARYVYQTDPQHNNGFIVFDCLLLKEKKRNFLFNSSNSALLHSGVTLYFKNIGRAQPQQVVKLIDFIVQSDFCKYDRILFSAVTEDTESGRYICDYIRDHCTCCSLALPSLNETRDRLPTILAVYVNLLNMELGKQVIGFTAEAMRLLQDFHWTNNYFQLFRVVRSLLVVSTDAYIGKSAVLLALSMERSPGATPQEPGLDLNQPLDKISFDIVKRVLKEENNNQSKAAARLGISRTTLWRILKNNG